MNTSPIEWTSATWNPVTGCTKVSPGCDHCYAETFAERFRGVPGHPYEQGFDLQLRPERLAQPLRWRKPSRIFVNSMSDLFQAEVPQQYIAQVWLTMLMAPWHTFQVLTKRGERMERVLSRPTFWELVNRLRETPLLLAPEQSVQLSGPSRNIWLGVSVEAPTYYSRIRHLQRTPAHIRFLSCEPLLAPLPELPLDGIHWVIVGGESGHGARPMDPDWARGIRDQCRAAGVAFFFKQCGGPNKKRAGRLLDGRTWDEMPSE
jgi:protein gp37